MIEYNLILCNDDVNDMLYIITALYDICDLDKEKCTELMFEAHENGSAKVTSGTFEEINAMKELLIAKNIIAKVEKLI
ncbi:MAG: ATP-dependent Clp protease adaptor ClpS [Paludibacter sp.]